MLPNLILTLLFAAILFINYKRVSRIDVTTIVVALYMLVAFCGVILFSMDVPRFKDLALWPYLYFFIVFFYQIKPLNKVSYFNNKIANKRPLKIISYLVLIYVICAILAIYYSWNNIVAMIILADWESVKKEAYAGVSEKIPFIFAYAEAFGLYFRFFIFPYCFYLFTQKQVNFCKPLLLLVFCIVATTFHFLATAYRGGLFSILILLFISFFLFRKDIPKLRRRIVTISGLVVMTIVLIITISITNSRFENSSSGAFDSFLYYFGISMIDFNGGIATKATSYMGGNYYFMAERGLERDQFWIDRKYGIDTNDGSNFETLIGCFYIDFGPIQAFIILLAVSFLLTRLLNFKKRYWSSIYLFYFYLELLTAGVFHGPSSLHHQVKDVLIIYCFIYLIEKKYEGKNKYQNCSLLSQTE